MKYLNILSISPYLPSEHTGHAGAQAIYRNLISLSKDNEVKVLCFVDKSNINQTQFLKSNNIQVDFLELDRNIKGNPLLKFIIILKNVVPIFRSIFLLEPFYASKYYRSKMRKLVLKARNEFQPDIVHIEYNIMHHYSKLFSKCPCVLTEHDITSKLKERMVLNSTNVIDRLKNYLSYKIWYRFEPKALKTFDTFVTVTEEDRSFSDKWNNLPKSYVIPPPVSVKLPLNITKEPFTLCFIGSFNRKPNLMALKIIVNDIFPAVRENSPRVSLKVAGKYLSNSMIIEMDKLEGVEYYGFVENIDTFVASSSLFIAPIKIGAGLKMKITHSLACGTPVLTTSIGAEGIPISKKEGLWVEDEIHKMVRKCIVLISDPKYLAEIGKIGQKKVKELFSKECIRAKLMSMYTFTINQFKD